MPQITFEYTRNVSNCLNYRQAAHELHHLIVQLISTDLESCKTRINKIDDFIIGDGLQSHAFVHVTIAIMSGRAQEIKEELSSKALDLLMAHIPVAPHSHDVQITVEVRDLDRSTYRKQILAQADRPSA